MHRNSFLGQVLRAVARSTPAANPVRDLTTDTQTARPASQVLTAIARSTPAFTPGRNLTLDTKLRAPRPTGPATSTPHAATDPRSAEDLIEFSHHLPPAHQRGSYRQALVVALAAFAIPIIIVALVIIKAALHPRTDWAPLGRVPVPLSASTPAASSTPVTVPGAPAGLTATPGDAQVTLSWAAPAAAGGSRISGYKVYFATTPGTTPTTSGTPGVQKSAAIATTEGASVTVGGLANGTTYYFRVTAVNRVGESPASNELQAVPATVPGAPAGLTATAGNAQVTLSWAAPASDGGSPISGYLIYQGTSPGGETSIPVNGAPVTGTSYTVTGLTNRTTYFKVVAVNRVGRGPASTEVKAVPAG